LIWIKSMFRFRQRNKFDFKSQNFIKRKCWRELAVPLYRYSIVFCRILVRSVLSGRIRIQFYSILFCRIWVLSVLSGRIRIRFNLD
jgi:hypothetical protein